MNSVIALCSFCETHGPRVVLCTQAFHDPEFILDENGAAGGKQTSKSFYGPSELLDSSSGAESLSQPSTSNTELCEGCTSISQDKRGYVSNDDEARVSYITSQYPLHQELLGKVKQACFRSLSCEVSSGQGDSLFFGNENTGYVLSHNFTLADSQARGFNTKYSIIIVMKDKPLLLNLWKFLEESLKTIVHELQEKADKVHADEQSKANQRAIRLDEMMAQLAMKTFLRKKSRKARSLKDLTNDQEIFSYLHDRFVWILISGAKRLKEKVVEGSPTEDTKVDLEHHRESEGLVEASLERESDCSISSVPGTEKDLHDVEEENSKAEKNISDTGLEFSSVRELFDVLGQDKFHILAYHTVIGNQIIVKGQYPSLTKSLIICLQVLLPSGCFRPIYNSTTYEDSWKCNFLSVLPEVPIPDHVSSSELHIQVNITEKENQDTKKLENFDYTLVTTAKLPKDVPQVLSEMERVIADTSFSLDTMNSFIYTEKYAWLAKVKMVYAYSHDEQSTKVGMTKLSTTLGAKEQDMKVLKYWKAGLSEEHKKSVLGLAMKNKYQVRNIKKD